MAMLKKKDSFLVMHCSFHLVEWLCSALYHPIKRNCGCFHSGTIPLDWQNSTNTHNEGDAHYTVNGSF